MDSEANKAIVKRYMEMWNTGNVALADEVLAPTYVDYAHPEVTGPAEVKRTVLEVRTAFPDFHIAIEYIVGEEDIVAWRGIIRRTQQGKEVVSHVMWFCRLADGLMLELWTGNEAVR